MSLKREVYDELAAVVGDEFISDKPYVLAGNRSKTPDLPKDFLSADAIVQPGSTDEVVSIIKICNKYNIAFIPGATNLSMMAYAKREGTIILHMKRMNRILEINAEDRYAVIEAGVRHVQLRPELMKRGLTYATAAVGPGGSVLANFAATSGDNHNQHGMSRACRYLLAMEVVSPTGEVLTTGSLEAGAGWSFGDGPGMGGLRGLLRGYFGNHAQFGVVTRIAIALDEFRGPRELEISGISPTYSIRTPGAAGRVFVYNYESLDDVRDAMLKLGKSEVGYTVLKYFNLPLVQMMSTSANEFHEKWARYKDELKMPLIVYLATWSPEELAFETKCLADIAAETGGAAVREEIRSWFDDNMDFFIMVSFLQRVPRLGGSWRPIKLGADSVSHIIDAAKAIPEFIYDYMGTGKLFDAPYSYQIIPMEYGHMAHLELLYAWDRLDPAAGGYAADFARVSSETDISHGYHSEMPGGGLTPMTDALGPKYSNFHVWLKALHEAFDPNNLSNPQM
jgi:hypothetical protein